MAPAAASEAPRQDREGNTHARSDDPATAGATRRSGRRVLSSSGFRPHRSRARRRPLPHCGGSDAVEASARADGADGGRRGHRARRETVAAEVAHSDQGHAEAAGVDSLSGADRFAERRLRADRRRLGQGPGAADRPDRAIGARNDGGGDRQAFERRGRLGDAAARRSRGRSEHLWLSLVLAVDPALQAAARPRARRLAVRAAFRARDADLLPARRRQGAGPQGRVDAGRAGHRHGDARPVRDRAAIPAVVHAEPHNQPHRRRTRAAALPSPLPPAARLFRDPRRRADGRADA